MSKTLNVLIALTLSACFGALAPDRLLVLLATLASVGIGVYFSLATRSDAKTILHEHVRRIAVLVLLALVGGLFASSSFIAATFCILLCLSAYLHTGHGSHQYALVTVNGKSVALQPFSDLSEAAKRAGAQHYPWGTRFAAGTRVLIAGAPVSAEQLQAYCQELKAAGCYPIIITDALENFEELRPALHELNEHQVAQISPAIPIICLLKGIGSLFFYAYPKVDVTTTMALLFDGGKKVLVMVRDREPFKNYFALPGGFLDSMLETLKQCAVRELHEEVLTKAKRWLLQPEELALIDVRSEPTRDKRGHVVDHGYAWLVPADREAEVLAAIEAGDDAKKGSATVVSVEEALERGLAFDHAEFLKAAVAWAANQQPQAQPVAQPQTQAELAPAAQTGPEHQPQPEPDHEPQSEPEPAAN